MTVPNSQIQETFLNLVEDPTKRFQTFFDHYVTINVNVGTPVNSYFRSGKEILRMGNIYFQEHDYFHSFVLYSRFIVLFLDKIKEHPNYSSCSKTELNAITKEVKALFPRAEKLKKYIKDIFEAQAIEHRQNQEELESKTIPTAPPALPDPLSTTQLDEIKRKYNLENENEFKLLQDSMNDQSIVNNANNANPINKSNVVPAIDRNLKPKQEYINSYNFRTIIIPKDLAHKFLDLAYANTSKNIETCGILAGKLNQNTFTLSHCIIPKQSGSSDTCTTEQEHELFDTIDQLNLITLGWIHTHPSQTAFLSSIDLHTHYGYQIMIPEAIAIVCAPKHNENKTFILSPDFGLKEIGECNKSGFHPHTINPSLFEECDHVREDTNIRANLIDLRIVTSTNRYF